MTIDCWIKPANTSGVKSIISKTGVAGQHEFDLQLNAATPRIVVSYNGTTLTTLTALYAIAAGDWTHLTVVADGTYINFYINGALAGKFLFSGIPNGTSNLRIGTNGTNHFAGEIDEVRLLKKVITPPFESSAIDETNNQLHGSNAGTIGSSNPIDGNHMLLNGTSQYLYSPVSSALSLNGSWTIETYIRPGSAATNQYILSKGNGTLGSYYNYGLQISNTAPANRIRLFFQDDFGSNYEVYSNTQVVNGQWYHVAGTWNGSTLSIYINGQLEASVNYPGVTPATNSLPVVLGRIYNGTSYFGGAIDSVRISDIARTSFFN